MSTIQHHPHVITLPVSTPSRPNALSPPSSTLHSLYLAMICPSSPSTIVSSKYAPGSFLCSNVRSSHLRFWCHPIVPPLNQGPIHVRGLGTTMLDCIVHFPFEVPTPYLGHIDPGYQDNLLCLHFRYVLCPSRVRSLTLCTHFYINNSDNQ
ncbi:hypothetical protein M405DRAFT_367630 [Rhizopogon salebrosus TDB-379]|nr:hypothetical protein M405DRAFT_367630 [Rhizopogon salebrosus TDB-379]